MSTAPVIIEDNNLSNAWYCIFKLLTRPNVKELSPLVLTLTDFDEIENIRNKLDKHFEALKMPTIQTVSETIFPHSLYEYVGYDREKLYERYKKNLTRIKKIKPSNRKGTYFSRLIAYGEDSDSINQLEIIIKALKDEKPARRSKLQASIFNPLTDHINTPMQGFPCLQHVTFFRTKDGGLVLNSFYAHQFFFKRAYGNWLGLINLGKFVAKETGLKFERFNCFIGVETLDNIGKVESRNLLASMKQIPNGEH